MTGPPPGLATLDAKLGLRFIEPMLSLQDAAYDGKTSQVRRLLAKGIDVNALDKDGWTPLEAAADQGHAEICRLLLEAGADVDRSDDGWTPLIYAILGPHPEVCQLLLQAGATVPSNDDGWTALCLAIPQGPEACRAALEAGADVNAHLDDWTPLRLAIQVGDVEVCRVLLEAGADVNKVHRRRAPLHHAIDEGDPEVCRVLLEAGADVRGASWWSPRGEALLRLLVEFGCSPDELLDPSSLSVKEAKTLLELGASPNFLDPLYGQTPLYRACMKSAEMVRLMLKYGADPLALDTYGNHSLHFCACWGYAARARPLLDAGVPADFVECGKYTALPSACSLGHYKMTKLLLERGADPNLGNPLRGAAAHGSAAIVELLLEYGAVKNDEAREAAKRWFPDLLSKAKADMSQWGSTGHRWGKNCVGERTLEMWAGTCSSDWTDEHARVLELLD